MKIGVFDSGIGGLTVLKKLINKYPNNDYIYFGDIINLPYGNKSLEQLEMFANNIIKFFISQQVELIVIACGTISSNIYDKLKESCPIPIIDVINPTVNHLKEISHSKIGLLGTEMTIKSRIFEKKLQANDIEVISMACPKFVPIIEGGKIDTPECDAAIEEYLTPFIGSDIDSLVLGCTHYPLLDKKIRQFLSTPLVNMADSIKLPIDSGTGTVTLYFSMLNDVTIKNVDEILEVKHPKIEKVLI